MASDIQTLLMRAVEGPRGCAIISEMEQEKIHKEGEEK